MRPRPRLPNQFAAALFAWCVHVGAPAATPAHPDGWTLAWYAPLAELEAPQPTWHDVTVRKVVRVAAAGRAVRVQLSNAFGTRPLPIAVAHVAHRGAGADTVAGSDRALTFGGREAVLIAPGAQVFSDAVDLPVEADTDLAISLYFAEPATVAHVHDEPREALYVTRGREPGTPQWRGPLLDAGLKGGFAVVQAVEVVNPAVRGVVVAFGDSITDGYGVGADQGASWPEQLNRRLRAAGIGLTVVNAGLSGNALLSDNPLLRYGRAASTRLDTDVLGQAQVCAVIVAIGINDVGLAQGAEVETVAKRLAEGYRQVALRLRAQGIAVHGATLAPFEGATYDGYHSPAKDRQRQQVNAFIRDAGVFDAVLDFDRALRSPDHPNRLRPAFDVGDRVHPNAQGARAMADAAPLASLASSCPPSP